MFKRLFLVVALVFGLCSAPVYAAVTIVKAVDKTSFAIGEKVISFHVNTLGNIGIIQTNTNFYVLTLPTVAGGLYTLEKVPMPALAVGDALRNFYWDTTTGKPIAIETDKFIYFFLYS